MASAAANPTARRRSGASAGRRPRAPSRLVGPVRWNRVGRVALLLVLLGVLALYIEPAHSYWATWREARHQEAQVDRLRAENRLLLRRRHALEQPATIEREARELGMVRRGERGFVLRGLPGER